MSKGTNKQGSGEDSNGYLLRLCLIAPQLKMTDNYDYYITGWLTNSLTLFINRYDFFISWHIGLIFGYVTHYYLVFLDQFFFWDPVVLESICYRTRAKRLINDSKTTGELRKFGRVKSYFIFVFDIWIISLLKMTFWRRTSFFAVIQLAGCTVLGMSTTQRIGNTSVWSEIYLLTDSRRTGWAMLMPRGC